MKLGSGASITKIKTSTTNVRHFVVESCDGPSPVTWQPVFDLELSNTGTGQLQVEVNKVKTLASWLKFKVLSGWSDFVTFHQVGLVGWVVGWVSGAEFAWSAVVECSLCGVCARVWGPCCVVGETRKGLSGVVWREE